MDILEGKELREWKYGWIRPSDGEWLDNYISIGVIHQF
jgi:hypothetical protein